jgi:catechol 2,3-dioxygenase-like lactoylglutathione lyase family enzyme
VSAGICIARLDHFVLTVRDVEATCEFYTRVLGMEVVRFGAGRTALRFGAQKINLHPVENAITLKAERPEPGSADVCFLADTPIPQVVEHLKRCGVAIVEGPSERAGARGPIMSVYVRDPDMNLVEISNSIER